MESEDILLLKRRIERERQSRKEAERILEAKALELYRANVDLQKLNENLENQIKKRTADLEKSKARYKELVESANEIVYEVDVNFKLVYVNPAACHLMLYSLQELSEKTFLELVDDSYKETVKNYIIKCLKEKISQGYLEFPAKKKNGDIIWLGQNFQLEFKESDGALTFNGLKAMARDISDIHSAQLELKLNEEKYRLIMENMNLGFMEVTNDGIITRVYQALCNMTGYTENELIGKSAEEIFLPDEFKSVMHNQSLKREQGEISAYEVQIIKKDGQRLWVLISGGPIFNQKGEVIGSVGIHYDISNLKRVQTELAEAKEVAEASQMAEQEFLANMSHEIRTPLNAVIGMAHLLYDTNPSVEQIEYLDIIKNSANFLHALISDVLDMAKIEARKVEIKNAEFDIVGVLKSIHRTYELKSQGKGVKVILDLDPQIDVLVIGDELIFNQILNNLLSNAEKFTDTGYIKLSAQLKNKVEENIYMIQVSVEDTGQGMDQQRAELVFQKFKQVHDKNSSKTKGTGLGLAIVKELIELQGGTIGLNSVPNKGTTFFFELPLELTSKKINKNAEKEFDETVLQFSNIHVLIAEDNALNLKYLSTLLRKWNINYDYAFDGKEAVRISKLRRFDLILMDIQMPNLNGYEATVSIRSEFGPNQKTPIVALTASAMVIEKDKASEAGMNGVLTKPFTPDQLKRTLNKYLNKEIEKNKENADNNKMKEELIDNQINQSSLNDYFGNDVDFKKVVFETFIEEIEPQIEEFKVLLEEKKWSEIGGLAHKMKPSFSMVGLQNTELLLKSIETGIITSGITQEIENQIDVFLTNFPQMYTLVKEEFNNF
jgi:PAS domain S-box-containing protein